MPIDWYQKVIRLDPRLLGIKFSFGFLLFYKITPSQKSIKLMHENNLFASVGCKNAQMAQKRTLE